MIRLTGIKALLAATVALLSMALILSPTKKVFSPPVSSETPWLFQVLALWAERQANLAWHRGGPEKRPDGHINQLKYHAQQSLARSAAKARPVANYKLASTWLRFSLALNSQNLKNWRLAAFLAGLAGDLNTAYGYIKKALHHFPNHPLILLERVSLLGEHMHPKIHIQWAEEAYYAFLTIPDKPAIGEQDIRAFFLQYVKAIGRNDPNFATPESRKLVLHLYQELAKFEPEALNRGRLYPKLKQQQEAYEAAQKAKPSGS